MCNQMGAAPGAKWGDLVTGIYTAQGDLAMIAPHGIIAFAACCFYPIRYIIKNWTNEPTVGGKYGDGLIHNDARYCGIHQTDPAIDRKSVVWGKSGSARVDLGGRLVIENKKRRNNQEQKRQKRKR